MVQTIIIEEIMRNKKYQQVYFLTLDLVGLFLNIYIL